MGSNPPFDPLRPCRLPAPQNADVPALQDKNGIRVFCKIIPNLTPLLSLEKTLVDFDFHKVSRPKLLANFFKNRFTESGLTDADARAKVPGLCLDEHVIRNHAHSCSRPLRSRWCLGPPPNRRMLPHLKQVLMRCPCLMRTRNRLEWTWCDQHFLHTDSLPSDVRGSRCRREVLTR